MALKKRAQLDKLAKELFGRTLTTAFNAGKCVSCGTRVQRRKMEPEEKEVYKDHGFCPSCEATTL